MRAPSPDVIVETQAGRPLGRVSLEDVVAVLAEVVTSPLPLREPPAGFAGFVLHDGVALPALRVGEGARGVVLRPGSEDPRTGFVLLGGTVRPAAPADDAIGPFAGVPCTGKERP